MKRSIVLTTLALLVVFSLWLTPNNVRAQGDYLNLLILTPEDSGRTITIQPNTIIWLQMEFLPGDYLEYDHSILQYQSYFPDRPRQGWRLVTIGSGTTLLTLTHRPVCAPDQPCPQFIAIRFQATIIVRGDIHPLPPIIPRGPDVYIGTAYLDQTVQAQPGQIIVLELPFLSPQQAVAMQFDYNVLRLVSGQPWAYQPGGWRFQAVQAGTTTITISGSDQTYFRVHIVVGAGTTPGTTVPPLP